MGKFAIHLHFIIPHIINGIFTIYHLIIYHLNYLNHILSAIISMNHNNYFINFSTL